MYSWVTWMMTGRAHDNFFSILLVGESGSGKSETGNTLLETNYFDVAEAMNSATKHVSYGSFKFRNHEYRVYDTPGWFDTQRSEREVSDELQRYAQLSPHGLDAVFFVTKSARNRITTHTSRIFDMMTDSFSQAVIPYTGVVFTDAADLSRIDVRNQLQAACRGENPNACKFWNLVSANDTNHYADRLVVMGNLSPARRHQDREDMLASILHIMDKNQACPYKNEHFLEATMRRLELDERISKMRSHNNRQYLRTLRDNMQEGKATAKHCWEQLQIREAQEFEEFMENWKSWRMRLFGLLCMAVWLSWKNFWYPKQFIAVLVVDWLRLLLLYCFAYFTDMCTLLINFHYAGNLLEFADKWLNVSDIFPGVFAFFARAIWASASDAHGFMVDMTIGSFLFIVNVYIQWRDGSSVYGPRTARQQSLFEELLLGCFVLYTLLCAVRLDDNGPGTPFSEIRWRMFWQELSENHEDAVPHHEVSPTSLDRMAEREGFTHRDAGGPLPDYIPVKYEPAKNLSPQKTMKSFQMSNNERTLMLQNAQLQHDNLVLQHENTGNLYTAQALRQHQFEVPDFLKAHFAHPENTWLHYEYPPQFWLRSILIIFNFVSIFALVFPTGVGKYFWVLNFAETLLGIYYIQEWLPVAVDAMTKTCERRISEMDLVKDGDHMDDHMDPAWVVKDLSAAAGDAFRATALGATDTLVGATNVLVNTARAASETFGLSPRSSPRNSPRSRSPSPLSQRNSLRGGSPDSRGGSPYSDGGSPYSHDGSRHNSPRGSVNGGSGHDLRRAATTGYGEVRRRKASISSLRGPAVDGYGN